MPAWFLIRKGGDFQEIGRKHHIPTAAARLIRNRGAVTDEDFEHIAEELADDLEYTYEEILHMSEEEMYQVSDKIVEKFYENYSGGKKLS